MSQFPITKEWILAGKAIFTVHNDKNQHYTYKVNKGDDAPIWFVHYLTGPNNESDYSYLGVLNPNGIVRLTKASKLNPESLPVKVIRWAIQCVWLKRAVPPGYGIEGEGRCGMCGKKLTNPNSLKTGYGPECSTRL